MNETFHIFIDQVAGVEAVEVDKREEKTRIHRAAYAADDFTSRGFVLLVAL